MNKLSVLLLTVLSAGCVANNTIQEDAKERLSYPIFSGIAKIALPPLISNPNIVTPEYMCDYFSQPNIAVLDLHSLPNKSSYFISREKELYNDDYYRKWKGLLTTSMNTDDISYARNKIRHLEERHAQLLQKDALAILEAILSKLMKDRGIDMIYRYEHVSTYASNCGSMNSLNDIVSSKLDEFTGS